mmetsp:Transcript_13193/g.37114  ORF Transcript_13193/g.37114 Transcript_13193/m.37114 type:complete len:525 (-) Transcript_13193:1505-3079(-)
MRMSASKGRLVVHMLLVVFVFVATSLSARTALAFTNVFPQNLHHALLQSNYESKPASLATTTTTTAAATTTATKRHRPLSAISNSNGKTTITTSTATSTTTANATATATANETNDNHNHKQNHNHNHKQRHDKIVGRPRTVDDPGARHDFLRVRRGHFHRPVAAPGSQFSLRGPDSHRRRHHHLCLARRREPHRLYQPDQKLRRQREHSAGIYQPGRVHLYQIGSGCARGLFRRQHCPALRVGHALCGRSHGGPVGEPHAIPLGLSHGNALAGSHRSPVVGSDDSGAHHQSHEQPHGSAHHPIAVGISHHHPHYFTDACPDQCRIVESDGNAFQRTDGSSDDRSHRGSDAGSHRGSDPCSDNGAQRRTHLDGDGRTLDRSHGAADGCIERCSNGVSNKVSNRGSVGVSVGGGGACHGRSDRSAHSGTDRIADRVTDRDSHRVTDRVTDRQGGGGGDAHRVTHRVTHRGRTKLETHRGRSRRRRPAGLDLPRGTENGHGRNHGTPGVVPSRLEGAHRILQHVLHL